MEVSVEASLEHIQNFIHPQVIIIDDPNKEDAFFVDSIRSKAVDIRKPIIELPSDATQNLMWLARLDSGSLAGLKCTVSGNMIGTDTYLSMDYHICRHFNPSAFRVFRVSCTATEINRERGLLWYSETASYN